MVSEPDHTGPQQPYQCPTPAADLLTHSRVTKGKEADQNARNLKIKNKKGREYDYFDYIAACNKSCIVPCVVPQPLHEQVLAQSSILPVSAAQLDWYCHFSHSFQSQTFAVTHPANQMALLTVCRFISVVTCDSDSD